MSNTAKIIIAVIVIIVVAAGVHYWYRSTASSQSASNQTDSTALPSGSDNSDAALDQDMNSINGQMQASNSDSAEIDQSVDAQASN